MDVRVSEWPAGTGSVAAPSRAIEWGNFDAASVALPDMGMRRPWWYRLIRNWRLRMLIETHHWE